MLQFDERSRARLERVATPIVPSGGISIDDMLDLLRRRAKLIAGVTALVLAAALGFALLVTPGYKSTAQILIDPRDLQVVKNEIKPSTSSTDVGIAVVETEARVVSSETVLKRAVTTLGLDHDDEFVGGLPGLRDLFNMLLDGIGVRSAAPDAADTPLLRALRTLQKRLYVQRPERTYVVDVSIDTKDPLKSARIAEGVAQAYLDEQAGARVDAARNATASLSGRLDELRDRVAQAEDKVEAYKAAHNIVGSGGGLVNEQQLSEINTQLVSARAAVAAQKARYDQIVGARGDLDAMPEAVEIRHVARAARPPRDRGGQARRAASATPAGSSLRRHRSAGAGENSEADQ